MVAATLAWGLVLAGGVVWSVYQGKPTAREQTTVAQAKPTVDRAVAEVVSAAAGAGRAVVAISGFDRVGECPVTVLRSGARYQRTVTAYVPVGSERALLSRVALRLPASYGVTERRGSAPGLVGDVGLFTQLTGAVRGPGEVRFVIDTGSCRPEGDVAADEPAPASASRVPVQSVLTTLGVTAARWRTYRVSCANGAPLSTVEAETEAGTAPGRLDDALDATIVAPVLATADVLAYRKASVDVAVRTVGGRLLVTATTLC